VRNRDLPIYIQRVTPSEDINGHFERLRPWNRYRFFDFGPESHYSELVPEEFGRIATVVRYALLIWFMARLLNLEVLVWVTTRYPKRIIQPAGGIDVKLQSSRCRELPGCE